MKKKPKSASQIFIASSSEGKASAESIGKALASEGFDILYWWEAFPLGQTNIEGLERIAEQSFGAVFVLTSDDMATVRGVHRKIPRDNVVFEFGLFVGKKTRRRAVAVIENGVKAPSDFTGLTHEEFDPAQPKFPKTIKHFEHIRFSEENFYGPRRANSNLVPIFSDSGLNKALILDTKFPSQWCERKLYVGLRGARAWLRMSNAEIAKARRQEESAYKKLEQAQKRVISQITSPSLYVSLGPGDARSDQSLLLELVGAGAKIGYIPVDINFHLVKNAVDSISSDVNVLMGLAVDFEDRIDFIFEMAREKADGLIVAALLGNTLANLDVGEDRFITRLTTHMNVGDYLLLDIVVAGEKWSAQVDERLKIDTYEDEYKRFLSVSESWEGVKTIRSIADEFSEAYEAVVEDHPHIAGSKVVNVRNKKTRRRIAKNTRYNWLGFLAWIESRSLEVVATEYVSQGGCTDDAVVLLRKKQR